MFKNISFVAPLPGGSLTGKYSWDMEDSDFGIVRLSIGTREVSTAVVNKHEHVADIEVAVLVVREYSSRNLDVGKNLALLSMLWMDLVVRHHSDMSVETYCKAQDEFCPKFFLNWEDIAKERNEWLNKLMVLV